MSKVGDTIMAVKLSTAQHRLKDAINDCLDEDVELTIEHVAIHTYMCIFKEYKDRIVEFDKEILGLNDNRNIN